MGRLSGERLRVDSGRAGELKRGDPWRPCRSEPSERAEDGRDKV